MHDTDRTRLEYERGIDALEAQGFGFPGESAAWEQETLGQETFGGFPQQEVVLPETYEMELASQLLEVTTDQELDRFLGNVFRSVGRAVGGFVRSPVGQALGGVLKNAARTALPIAGAALGNILVPGVGGAIGGKLASAAGSLFGLELEGLAPEDREFETAKQFVRFAADAVKRAAQAPPTAPPQQVARAAVTAAAQRFAPGLLQTGIVGGGAGALGGAVGMGAPGIGTTGAMGAPMGITSPVPPPCACGSQGVGAGGGAFGFGDGAPGISGYPVAGPQRSGRWYRRGRRIVIVGA
jgi:hypothetical protein